MTRNKETATILIAYQSGANSFIAKPQTFKAYVDIIRSLTKYWLETVELPIC